ncbi:MAG: hypothetical protein ABSE49_17005 [Polyangiaceae bacterium]
MRSFNSKALALGIAAIAASGMSSSAGCSSTKPTEIIPGALTQVQVPKDLAGIQVEVVGPDGTDHFCNGYAVSNGLVELPSTLGVIAGAPNSTIRIIIRGYDNATSNDLLSCNHLTVDQQMYAPGTGSPPRVLREAVLTFVDQQELFLPMSLSYSCYDMDCSTTGTDQTCIAGQCASDAVNSATLPAFSPGMVDGTQQCFDPNQCFDEEQPAVLVDPTSCTYEVPPTLAAAGSGLNVKIAYTDETWVTDPVTGLVTAQAGVPTEEEVLSTDQNEGFYIPDPTKPTQFALAHGLCLLQQAVADPTANNKPPPNGPATFHTISDVEVAVGCPSKLPLLPFCAAEQHGNVSSGTSPAVLCNAPVTLEPAPSAVYIAMDNSASMGGNSGGAMYGAFGAKGAATALNLSFAFPVFKHTYIAFDFLDHELSDCNGGNTSYLSPLIPFGLASAVQPQVAAELLNPPSPPNDTTPDNGPETYQNPSPLYLDGALGPKAIYQAIINLQATLKSEGGIQGGLNVGAAMLFVNRYPTPPSTGDAGAGGADSGTDYPITATDCKTVASSTTDPNCGTDPNCQDLASEAKTQYQQNGLQTYFVVLNDQELEGAQVVQFYKNVAASAGAGVSVIDATMASSPQALLGSFESQLFSAATCLYDLPTGIDSNAQLAIEVPPGVLGNMLTTSVPSTIPAAVGTPCTAANASSVNGWSIDNGHIRICGMACSTVQGIIGATVTQAFAAAEGDAGMDAGIPTAPDGGPLSVPDVPLVITENCVDGGESF